MNYSAILEQLKQASTFDLYRLNVAIKHELENPQRIAEIRRRLRPGQEISYFDYNKNKEIAAKVVKLKQTRVLVEHTDNGELWNIPFAWINLDNVETDISLPQTTGLDRNQLKVGDIVGFQDRQNNHIYGRIIRLNPKTVTLITEDNSQWRVAYKFLYPVIDGQPAQPNSIEGVIVDR